MPDSDSVLLTYHELGVEDAVMALLTLNRPDQMNPLDYPTVKLLRARLAEVGEKPGVRMIAFTGEGRAFSAGGDMKKYIDLHPDPVEFPRFLEDLHDTFDSLAAMPMPVVALVNGVALAGGLELALACDMVIASSSARIGDAHQPYGMMGGGGVLSRLPVQIGSQRARELFFTGRLLPASEALDWGLVNRVVEPSELLDAGLELAADIAAKSPLAIANAKRVLERVQNEGLNLKQALEYERELTLDYTQNSHDAREGLLAFSEKRKPRFLGR